MSAEPKPLAVFIGAALALVCVFLLLECWWARAQSVISVNLDQACFCGGLYRLSVWLMLGQVLMAFRNHANSRRLSVVAPGTKDESKKGSAC